MTIADVGPLDDFPEAAVRIVKIGEEEVGIVRWDGRLYAVRNRCPHLGAPVCRGRVAGHMTADPDRLWRPRVDHSRPIMVCPWHRWEFDLDTGRAIAGRLRLKTYAVEVRDGRVHVQLASRRVGGPAQAPSVTEVADGR